jgi:hypothetical protein
MEGEAAIAFAVLMAAREASTGASQEERARSEESTSVRISIGKASGKHDGHGHPVVPLLERPIARP